MKIEKRFVREEYKEFMESGGYLRWDQVKGRYPGKLIGARLGSRKVVYHAALR
jgi:hypothetical protein